MNQETLGDSISKKLEVQKGLLVEEVQTIKEPQDMEGEFPDTEKNGIHFAQKERIEKRIIFLEQRLLAVQSGKYTGKCNICGKEIPEEQQIARDAPTTCVSCCKKYSK